MKILQIGCGGNGSYFLPEVIECIEQEQISPYTKISIADSDIVEVKDIKPRGYQNFYKQDLGKNKAKVLANRLGMGIKVAKRITREEELKGYDLIILCVDNEKTREMVVKYCHKNNKEFLDLRAEGRRYFAMPKLSKVKDNLKFIDSKDLKEYSCQEKEDLKKGYIQKGNKICALIGIQMLLNLLRGHTNKINNGVI